MPYPDAIRVMAQNLLDATDVIPDIQENVFYMFWNAVLTHHFPIDQWYGIAPVTSISPTGSRPDFLVMDVGLEEENAVVVLEVKRPAEDTAAGRRRLLQELGGYVMQRFSITTYDTIYAVACIGLSFGVYKMTRRRQGVLKTVYVWTDEITASQAGHGRMANLAERVAQMTGRV